MNLPFTAEQFFALFAHYNLAIWPLQLVACALGLAAVVLAARLTPLAGRAVAGILAAFWLWDGAIYHLVFFRQINPIASLFGLFFVVEAGLLLAYGVAWRRLAFRARADAAGVVGALFIGYALVVYPLIGLLLGHGYPRVPLFGVAPCPTPIFTFGMLLWAGGRVPRVLLVIPLLWALIGTSAAVSLGVPQDFGLAAAGTLGTAFALWRGGGTRAPAGPRRMPMAA
jgi:hypothetical protein